MIRFYYYKHPKTGKIYSDQRTKGFETVPYKIEGIECELLIDYKLPEKEHKSLGVIRVYKDGQREVFEADPQYVKKLNPKNIRFQDGHIERYDSTKHC